MAAVADSKQPVNLKDLFASDFGKDEIAYCWSKAMDTTSAPEDPQVVAKAKAAFALAKQKGFQVSSGQ